MQRRKSKEKYFESELDGLEGKKKNKTEKMIDHVNKGERDVFFK